LSERQTEKKQPQRFTGERWRMQARSKPFSGIVAVCGTLDGLKVVA
jgi:hypothetical protein